MPSQSSSAPGGLPAPTGRIVLGIETSCDETAVALVRDDGEILADTIRAQLDDHELFGGIVPEIAARAHLERLDLLIERAMAEAGKEFAELGGVAATAGPGLIGGLVVGTLTAKVIAAVHDLPFLAINHLEAHALTARLTHAVAFPYLLFLASGGHCQFQAVMGVGRYRRLGTTLDDAAGEAFDKVAKMLGLGYPGGPAVEALARGGDPARFALPRPLQGQRNCNFSFSGLKTAVRLLVLEAGPSILQAPDLADLCASFQAAVGDVVEDRAKRALAAFRSITSVAPVMVVAGGVAANGYLRERLRVLAEGQGATLAVPPARLCTDNAVMVAWAGIERLALGLLDPLDVAARPRWPLDPDAEPLLGAGRKGAKA